MIAYVLVGIACFLAGMVALWAYDRIAYNRMMRFARGTETDWQDDPESWDPVYDDENWEADEVWDGPKNP